MVSVSEPFFYLKAMKCCNIYKSEVTGSKISDRYDGSCSSQKSVEEMKGQASYHKKYIFMGKVERNQFHKHSESAFALCFY